MYVTEEDRKEMARAVECGAALLDVKCEGWFRLPSLNYLNMRYKNTCLLARVLGHYTTGCEVLGNLTEEQRRTYGFRALAKVQARCHDDAFVNAHYFVLDKLWFEAINQRRKESHDRERLCDCRRQAA